MNDDEQDDMADVDLDLTPLIDVTFQIIIFFMIVMDFSSRTLEPVQLAEASTAVKGERDKADTILLNVGLAKKHRGRLGEEAELLHDINYWRIYHEGTAYTFDESDLRALRKKLNPLARRRLSKNNKQSEIPLIIRADKRAPWALVREIMQMVSGQLEKPIYKLKLAAKLPRRDQ